MQDRVAQATFDAVRAAVHLEPQRADEIARLMEKILWVPRVDKLPTIDGQLNDDVWNFATALEGWTQADLLLPSAEVMRRLLSRCIRGACLRKRAKRWAWSMVRGRLTRPLLNRKYARRLGLDHA